MKYSIYLLLLCSFLSSCASQYSRSRYANSPGTSYGWSYLESKNEGQSDIYFDQISDLKESNTRSFRGDKTQDISRLQEERKILYSGSLHLLVKNTDTTIARIKSIAKSMNGYVSESGSNNSTIFVPASQLHESLQLLKKIGSVQSYRIMSEDVTEKYMDMGIRLDNAKKARVRYLELLARAENVEAALKVEKELERLNGEIDVLEGKLKFWDHRFEYSIIQISYTEKKKLGILGWVGLGLYQTVKWLFIRG